MEQIINEKLVKVENALNTVISSVAQNNPSELDTIALLQADGELCSALRKLARHQANYSRLIRLRDAERKLDGQIKCIVQILADTRRELQDASFTNYPQDARRIPVDDLLRFAKSISQFTVPSKAKTLSDLLPPQHQQQENQVEDQGQPKRREDEAGANNLLDTLFGDQNAFINRATSAPFVPWPNEEAIRKGGLSIIQAEKDSGNNRDLLADDDEYDGNFKGDHEEENDDDNTDEDAQYGFSDPTKTLQDKMEQKVIAEKTNGDSSPPSREKPAFQGFSFD